MAKVMRNFLMKGSNRDDVQSADSDSDDEDGHHSVESPKPCARKSGHAWDAMRMSAANVRTRVSTKKVGTGSKGLGSMLRTPSKSGNSFGKDDAGAARMKTRMSKAVMSTITGMTRTALHRSPPQSPCGGAGFEEEAQTLLQELCSLKAVEDLEKSTAERLQLGSCEPADRSSKLSALRDFRDAVARESLALARRHSEDRWKSLEDREAKASMLEKQAREMQVSYLRDVTALRDKIRRLPPGTHEAIEIMHFNGLSHVDDAIQELVRSCFEEQVKQFLVEAAVEGEAKQLQFFLKSNFDKTLRLSEQRAKDVVAQMEGIALERDTARTELAVVKGNLDESQLHVNALEVCVAARDSRVVELTEVLDGVKSELHRLKESSLEAPSATKPPSPVPKVYKTSVPFPQALSPEAQLEAVHMEMQWSNLVEEARQVSVVESPNNPEVESLMALLGRAADLHSDLARGPSANAKQLLQLYSQINDVREGSLCRGDAEKRLASQIGDIISDSQKNLEQNFTAEPSSTWTPPISKSRSTPPACASPSRKGPQAAACPKASSSPRHAATLSADTGEFKQATNCELFVAELRTTQTSAVKRAGTAVAATGSRTPNSQSQGPRAMKAAAKPGSSNTSASGSTRKAGTQQFCGPGTFLR